MNEYPLVTVITVSFQAASSIEKTILSVINQTYPNIEYIVIDGGSTDDTVNIIDRYKDSISYWISEPDKGIYDAMNKGINATAGEWINFMNCGDVFVNSNVLSTVFCDNKYEEVDVIYGNSWMKNDVGDITSCKASNEISKLSYYPIYRHGASFVKTLIHKKNRFDLSKKKIGYALDFHCIHSMYMQKCRFMYIDKDILIYLQDGASNNNLKSAYYNFLIATQDKVKFYDIQFLLRNFVTNFLKSRFLKKVICGFYAFFAFYVMNNIVSCIPFWKLRRCYYKMLRMKIGSHSIINMSLYTFLPRKIAIGEHTHINQGCFIDARGGCEIGSYVSISHNVSIVTGSHDCNVGNFPAKYLPVKIEDYAWIGINATILQNVIVGKGAVVAAGAVVVENVPPFTIVGGVPAKVIGKRIEELDYKCSWEIPFV